MDNHVPLQVPASQKRALDVLQGLPPKDFTLGIGSAELDGIAHKFSRNLKDYGWRVAASKSLAFMFRAIYFRKVYRIYRINLEETRPSDEFDKHNFTFKILTTQNVDMIAQIENMAEWMRGQLTNSIAAGQMCLVALDGDKVAGFNLINFDNAILILVNLKKKLRRDFAWSEHIAVQKEFRRTGLGSQLRYRVFEELKRRGIRRLYGGTLRSNIASLALARSIGFKEIGDIHYRKILSFEKWQHVRVRG